MSPIEFIGRSLVLAIALLVLMRVVGKRLVGEVTAVDLVTGVSVGTIAGSTAITAAIPLWGGLLALLSWGAFEWVSVYLASRSPWFEKMIAGKATALVEDGQIVPRNLRKAMLSENSLRSMLQDRQIGDLAQVKEAVLEPSGKLGVIKRRQPEPT
jgi:uncharacterized membrane protein YcaP (DUF421 family)